jgi:hypothetical protein
MKLRLEKKELSFLHTSDHVKLEEALIAAQHAVQKQWGARAAPIMIEEKELGFTVTFMRCPKIEEVTNAYAMKDRPPPKKDGRMKDGCFYYPSGRVSIPGVGVMEESEMKLQLAQGRLRHTKKGALDYWSRVI